MRGSHRIIVQNADVKYDFSVRRNITILQGDSATGKTTLIEMISDYYARGADSGIDVHCDKKCISLSGRDWSVLLSTYTDSIIFIDEGNEFVLSHEFAKAVEESDNYYVIVTREGLPNLPYSIEEIYGIRVSGKYAGLKPVYNEVFKIYGDTDLHSDIRPKTVLVEDSNAGYEFYRDLPDKQYSRVISANGKSKIPAIMKELDDDDVLIIADGAAFGSEIGRVMKLLKDRKHTYLFLPESFEWLILKSGKIDGNRIQAILDNSGDYIESSQYFSWERFFTDLLVRETAGTYLQYKKSSLNPAYLAIDMRNKILGVMEHIDLAPEKRTGE